MIKINLLPREFQEKGKGLDWIILGYGVIGLIAIGGLAFYFGQVKKYEKNLAKKSDWSQQLATLRAKIARVEQLDAQKNLLIAKKNTVIQLFQGRVLYAKFMDTLYQGLPREVWITNLTLSEDGNRNIKAVAACSALSTDAIASWLETLENKTALYKDVSLSAIEVKNSGTQGTTFNFAMTMTFQAPPIENPGT